MNTILVYKIFDKVINKIVQYLKTRAQNFKIKLKKTVQEAKEKPKSKRKSFILGFTCVLAIFGVALAVPTLSAVAKDIPKGPPKFPEMVPAPSLVVQGRLQDNLVPRTEFINTSIPGVLVAIHTGAFAVGIVCGCIILVAVLQLENSYLNGKKY